LLIPASFLCGIFSGVFIWKGGQKTKRIDKVKARLRAALAMEHIDGYDSDAEGTEMAMKRRATLQTSAADPHNNVASETAVDEHMTVPASGEKERS
jgi:hypothetical protein